jgi:hypothetical protein
MEEFLKVNQTTTTGQIILNHKWECSHWQRHKGNIFTRMNSLRKMCSPVSDLSFHMRHECLLFPLHLLHLSKQNFSSRKNNELSLFTSSIFC